MNIVQNNIWNAYETRNQDDIFLVTTNAYIKKNGELVMGRGLAKQVRDRLSGFALQAGRAITRVRSVGWHNEYGLLWVRDPNDVTWGLFQVKHHFKDRASLDLIGKATAILRSSAESQPDTVFHLNFPGIGNGQLPRDLVLPVLETLPDNVLIYELGGA